MGGRLERDPILEEHEQVLWEKGILGEDSPDKLRQTVFRWFKFTLKPPYSIAYDNL